MKENVGKYETGLMKAFSRAAERPELSDCDFLEAILRERPDLKGKPAYFPAQGQFGFSIFIGNEVFKGPRANVARWFDNESDMLQLLQGRGLPVPEVTCVGKESYFYGMTRMPGVTLETELPHMTFGQKQALAEEVSDFMIKMARALPRHDGLYATQGDLREGNILVDPETKKLSAVIDFGLAEFVPKEMLRANHMRFATFRMLVEGLLEKKKAALRDSPPEARPTSTYDRSLLMWHDRPF